MEPPDRLSGGGFFFIAGQGHGGPWGWLDRQMERKRQTHAWLAIVSRDQQRCLAKKKLKAQRQLQWVAHCDPNSETFCKLLRLAEKPPMSSPHPHAQTGPNGGAALPPPS